MIEVAEIVAHVGTALVGAGAVYGGIRADIRSMHERIREAKDAAAAAHRRIDEHIDRRAQA